MYGVCAPGAGNVIEGERRFLRPLNPKYRGFELISLYTIRGGVVQRAGRRRADRKHYA
jgi:hypothetical protein